MGGILNYAPVKQNWPYNQTALKSYNLKYPLINRFTPNDKRSKDLFYFINNPHSPENNEKAIKLHEKTKEITNDLNKNSRKLLFYNTIGSIVFYFGIIVVKDTFYWTM